MPAVLEPSQPPSGRAKHQHESCGFAKGRWRVLTGAGRRPETGRGTPPGARGMLGAMAFHPAVRTWFERRFPHGPTEPQAAGWPAIAARREHADRRADRLGQDARRVPRLHRSAVPRGASAARSRPRRARPQVVYVSPLKALADDIQQNLQSAARRDRRGRARSSGCRAPEIRVAVRTGDTPPRRARRDAASARRTSWSPRPSRCTCCSPPSAAASCCAACAR